MTAVDAAQYYKDHIDQEREYVSILIAREVKAGETVTQGFFQASADEDGYELTDYNSHQSFYLTKADFAAQTVTAEGLGLPVAKEELDAEDLASIEPVKKGQKITVTVPLPMITTADDDGFIIHTEKGDMFMSNFALTAEFNYAGKKFESVNETLVAMKDTPPAPGILLAEEVTFAFKGGDYTAPAGSLLYKNPEDEDGYTVEPHKVPNLSLRHTGNLTDWQKHISAAEKQAGLKKAAGAKKPKFKPE